MSIGQLITEGVGSYGDVAHVITDGLDISGVVVTAPATILTEGFGTLSTRSPFVVMEGFGSTVIVTTTEVTPGGQGSWDKLRGKKKKQKSIKFSDFDSREEIAAALKAQIAPKTIFIEPESPIDDTEDDAILLAVVSRLIH